ncbi:hypothetical protein O3S80_16785 [Streptomyces sp. Lzd4kr]|nr:hypothetical protein [Streptomyces sp. Lzd4kr]
MSAGEGGELPRTEPQECRRQAEDYLGLGHVDVDVPRAVAFALLAVAGELHEIRRALQRRR